MTSVSGGAVLTNKAAYIIMHSMTDYKFDLPTTSTVTLLLLTVLPLLIASHTYCPLLEGAVRLRGVKERVADISPART